jgi:hypothetical protein
MRSLSTDRQTAATRAERQALRADRQAAKADIDALVIFLDAWATATQNQRIAFVRDLAQISRRTIKAAVL